MLKWAMGALCAVMACAPVGAATITQTTSDYAQNSIAKFDTTLGTLTAVTVTANVAKFGSFFFDNPSSQIDTVTWNANWSYSFGFTGEGDAKGQYGGGDERVGQLSLSGGGSFSVSPGAALIEGLGGFGQQTFNLNTAWFTDDIGGATFFGHGTWLQFANPLLGFSLVSGEGSTARPFVMGGEDFNGRSDFTVTYTYTPTVSSVPEPATWAMLIVGFGAVGAVARRRHPAFA